MRELAAGTLPHIKLAACLVQDCAFIEGLVRLLAGQVAYAPSLPDPLPGAQFLGVIGGPENTYFQRCFDELKVPTNLRAAPELTPTAKSFQATMVAAVETRRYEQKLAVLVGVEWSGVISPGRDPTLAAWKAGPLFMANGSHWNRFFFEENYATA